MRAWRISKAKRAADLSGMGAALEGGRWNDADVAAVYLGLSPAICCLETFVHQTRRPVFSMKLAELELPDEPELYLEPDMDELPIGWASLPADRPSMAFGTAWLQSGSHLGLIVPSAVLPLERNIVLNPRHPAMERVRIRRVMDFTYDERMFMLRS